MSMVEPFSLRSMFILHTIYLLGTQFEKVLLVVSSNIYLSLSLVLLMKEHELKILEKNESQDGQVV